MRFEEKLRQEMLLRGFNQQRLARAASVSDSEVSRILAGKSQPGVVNAFRLARAVGASLDYLADETMTSDGGREPEPILTSEQIELLELGRELGFKAARRLLESAAVLGPDVALRRLLGAEGRPLIEPAEPGRATPAPASAPAKRAGSA